MIIIGYPGIGKSRLVRDNPTKGYIDLESSLFNTMEDGDPLMNRRHSGWAIPYCKIALELSRQGYIVFVSSHEEVRRTFIEFITHEDIIKVCYPDLSLKADWLRRLRDRYQYYSIDGLEKDKRALLRAIDCYDEDINRLHNSSFTEIVIKSMDYDLEKLINGDDEVNHYE